MGHTLLIVDDSETVRSEVWAALKPTGIFEHHLEARDGMEGYKLLLTNAVSLVICDVVMPGADGYKFLLLKRKTPPEKRGVPVLMLSSQSSASSMVRTLNAGASDHVSKPFEVNELIARVNTHLELYVNRRALEQARERLSSSKVFLENVLASMADGLIVLDEREIVKRVNGAMLELLGGELADYVGRSIRDMVAADDLVNLTGIASALQEKTISGMTISLINVSGERIPTAVSAANLSAMSEEDGGFVLLIRDMRENFRVAEEESRAAAAARERSEELDAAHEEMERSSDTEKKQARTIVTYAERLSAVGQRVTGIGHQIVSPIWAVQSAGSNLRTELLELRLEIAGVIEDVDDSGDLARSLDGRFTRIEACFEQNLHAVQQLNEMSEALMNPLEINAAAAQDINVGELILECVSTAQATLQHHELRTELADVPTICCSRERVGQCITALLANATEVLAQKDKRCLTHGMQFTGRICVLTLARELEGVPGVLIAICDNGDGIAEELREAIFDEFFTTKPAGSGVGLGLSMTRKMVGEHGGTIAVSDDGELGGARFEIWLPCSGGPLASTMGEAS